MFLSKQLNEELRGLINQIDQSKLWLIYRIRKPDGDFRQIEAPIEPLKKLQKQLLILLETNTPKFPDYILGIKGRGITHSLKFHNKDNYLAKIDIKKCYPSTTFEMVVMSRVLDKLSLDEQELVKKTCFIEFNGVHILPTGAVTSPFFCNKALTVVDKIGELLIWQANRGGKQLFYTRYLDDIVLSSSDATCLSEAFCKIKSAIMAAGYRAHPDKSIFLIPGEDPIVITGIDLQRKTYLPRKFERKLRATINNRIFNNVDLNKDPVINGYKAYASMLGQEAFEFINKYIDNRQNRKMEIENA